MAEPFLSEIRIFSFNFVPRGWAPCNGQLLPINQNQAVFSLLGTTYGGNGTTLFALPNLQGRVPIHTGGGFVLGQSGGVESHTLTTQEMPAHTHQARASADGPTAKPPTGAFWSTGTGFSPYSATANTTMSSENISNMGGSQPHNNMSPFLTLNFCIALQGIFPSRN